MSFGWMGCAQGRPHPQWGLNEVCLSPLIEGGPQVARRRWETSPFPIPSGPFWEFFLFSCLALEGINHSITAPTPGTQDIPGMMEPSAHSR